MDDREKQNPHETYHLRFTLNIQSNRFCLYIPLGLIILRKVPNVSVVSKNVSLSLITKPEEQSVTYVLVAEHWNTIEL